MGVLPPSFGPEVPERSGRDFDSGPEHFRTPFLDLAEKKGSVAVDRNFARTPDPPAPQSPALHVSSICQFPGSPGIPPPAALTPSKCNGYLLRLFPSFSVRPLPSFLFMKSSSLVVRNLPPICPLPALSISRPPHLPETKAAKPAVLGGLGKRRKSPGGRLRRKEDAGGGKKEIDADETVTYDRC